MLGRQCLPEPGPLPFMRAVPTQIVAEGCPSPCGRMAIKNRRLGLTRKDGLEGWRTDWGTILWAMTSACTGRVWLPVGSLAGALRFPSRPCDSGWARRKDTPARVVALSEERPGRIL
jgi:hypothetical protein